MRAEDEIDDVGSIEPSRAAAGGRAGRLTAWTPLAVFVAAAMLCGPRLEPGLFCVVVSLAFYFGCKWLTWWEAADARRRAPLARNLGYLLAWPGADAEEFLGGSDPRPVRRTELAGAGACLLSGAGLVAAAASDLGAPPLGRAWLVVAGGLLLVHFGLFRIQSIVWRSRGVPAPPLMEAPFLASSLSDLWGRRWNRAFRDIVHARLFRPVHRRYGAGAATMSVFVLSGLVHEMAISLPAAAGWGLPTLYFLLQGAGIHAERSRLGRRLGLGRGWRGWIFSSGVLLLPAPLLFHPPFMRRAVLPLLEVIAS